MEALNNKLSQRTKRNTINLFIWTLSWTLSMALATFAPKYIWDHNALLTILSVILNFGLGLGMIIANIRYLKGLDELQQKIQLEAMALSLGVGVIGGLSYSLLGTTNIISTQADISHMVILIALTYLAGVIIGRIRYK